MNHSSVWLNYIAVCKLVEFLFPLHNPDETKVFYGTDSAGAHEHAMTVAAVQSTNFPYVLLRGATGVAAVPDHSKIHKSITSLTRRNQRNRRVIAYRKAKKTLSKKQLLKWRVPGYRKE